MIKLKLTTVGSSIGFILPAEARNRLDVKKGDAVYLTVGLRVYPGTTLHRIAMSEGRITLDDSLLDPTFYFSAGLDFDATVIRLKRFAADHPRFMFSADSRSAILPYLTRAASILRLPRPHWQYMGLFQRISRSTNRRLAPQHA